MFDTLAINYHDQGSGLPPWEEGEETPPEIATGFSSKDEEADLTPEDRLQKLFEMEGIPEEERPIELRTSEVEKLYANLLMKTDFEREFIEEMLEIDELSKEQEMRINELREKRREAKERIPTKTILI